ncbi:MAG: hypothetical protein O3A00_24580 [Planctomycetota bacterium]|nr:hypothetical protein [Planctomycetota bacterium]
MPITDMGSYVTTGQEFDSHWIEVNADRVANTLPVFVLPDAYARTNLTADVAAVEAAITSQESADNALSIAANGRDSMRVALRQRMIDFRKLADYRLKGSVYSTALQQTPQAEASEQKMLRALDDMADLWTRINADSSTPNFTPPLVFADGFALAAFQTAVAALRTRYRAVVDAENDARIGRKQRDALLQPLRDRFVAYRQGIEVEYGEQHAFTQSLPDVYPQAGSTPDPVTADGHWDPLALDAEINFTESTNPNLASYKIYMSRSATFDASTATLIATLLAPASQHRTTAGLENSGDTASYRVVVVLSTGNESSSNTVTITRP